MSFNFSINLAVLLKKKKEKKWRWWKNRLTDDVLTNQAFVKR